MIRYPIIAVVFLLILVAGCTHEVIDATTEEIEGQVKEGIDKKMGELKEDVTAQVRNRSQGIKEDSEVTGIQIRDQVWAGTIRVTGDTQFPPWATLTILPGTIVLFEKGSEVEGTDWTEWADDFIISHDDPTGRRGYDESHFGLMGKIIAVGTEDDPITFTSAQEVPDYADWDQVVLFEGSRLEHVQVSYAHNGVNINGKGVTIKNSVIHESLWSCIDVFSTGNTIEDNDVFHCWHQGIGVKVPGPNTIRGNYVHDAQLGVNCEFGADPTIVGNTFKAAPVNPDCPQGMGNDHIEATPDTPGGTYSGRLVYHAMGEM